MAGRRRGQYAPEYRERMIELVRGWTDAGVFGPGVRAD